MELTLLDQDEVWITADGSVVRLVDMDPDHRTNVMRWLERNATGIWNALYAGLGSAGSMLRGEMALDSIDSAMAEMESYPPDVYIRETRLHRRLVALVIDDAFERALAAAPVRR